VGPINPPPDADIIVHFGSGLGQMKPGTKLPSAALAWTWVGNASWMKPEQYPPGQKTAEEEVSEKAEAIASRIKAREAAGKFDESGRVPSIAEYHKRVMRTIEREQEERSRREPPERTGGPPPGYR
jgi:hypothetical protein